METVMMIGTMLLAYILVVVSVVVGNHLYFHFEAKATSKAVKEEPAEESVYLDPSGRFYTNRPTE